LQEFAHLCDILKKYINFVKPDMA
jgi:hypothetical protein